MRKTLTPLALVLCAWSLLWTVTQACGDKFLMIGRGARFNQAYAAIYPATILLYARSGRAASSAILDPKFQGSLTRAGHRVRVVRDEDQVTPVLEAGRFDLVLTDIEDVDAIKLAAGQSPTKPTVLPVLVKPTHAQMDAIKAQYHCELKTTDRPARYLSAIDDEMQTRVKSRSKPRTS